MVKKRKNSDQNQYIFEFMNGEILIINENHLKNYDRGGYSVKNPYQTGIITKSFALYGDLKKVTIQ